MTEHRKGPATKSATGSWSGSPEPRGASKPLPVTLFVNPYGSAEAFAYTQPDASDVVKEGMLSKRISGKTIYWSNRYVKIANGHLYMSLESGSEIRDALDLMQVTSIQLTNKKTKSTSFGDLSHQLSQKVISGIRSPSSASINVDDELLQHAKGQESCEDTGGQADHGAGSGVRETLSVNGEASETADIVSDDKQRRLRSVVGKVKAVQAAIRIGNGNSAQSGPSSPSATEDQPPGDRTFHEVVWENVFEIYSKSLGRTYYFRAQDESDCQEWIDAILVARKKAFEDYKRGLNLTFWQKAQGHACDFYKHPFTQMAVAFLLLFNFVINVIQTEMEVPIMRCYSLLNCTDSHALHILTVLSHALPGKL